MEDRRQRLTARIPEVLQKRGLAAWVLCTREASPDPVAAELGGGKAVGRMALIFGSIGGVFRRVALAASFDVTPLVESGIYDTVVPYADEGAKPHLTDWLGRIDEGPIGIDVSRDIPAADGLAAGMRDYLCEAAGAAVAARFVSAEHLIVDLLSTRSPEEIARIEEAVRRTQVVLARALTDEHIAAGQTTERDLSRVIGGLVEARGDAVEFLSINVGPTRGHSEPTDRVIDSGDVLRVDFGIRHEGWCSDIQRTVYVLADGEREPPEFLRRMWMVNRSAFAAAREALRPGMQGRDVDEAARSVIEAAGYDGYPHAAGHPIGRAVHDIGPILGPPWPERYGGAAALEILEGQVFAVEPIVYADDPRSGDRIHIALEHDLVVTADGNRLIGEDQEDIWLVGRG